MMYGLVFEQKSVNCCDLFKRHKKKTKGIRKIPLDLAKEVKCNGYDVLPGWKVCRKCYQQFHDIMVTGVR